MSVGAVPQLCTSTVTLVQLERDEHIAPYHAAIVCEPKDS
jgi:hypothetical protein